MISSSYDHVSHEEERFEYRKIIVKNRQRKHAFEVNGKRRNYIAHARGNRNASILPDTERTTFINSFEAMTLP